MYDGNTLPERLKFMKWMADGEKRGLRSKEIRFSVES